MGRAISTDLIFLSVFTCTKFFLPMNLRRPPPGNRHSYTDLHHFTSQRRKGNVGHVSSRNWYHLRTHWCSEQMRYQMTKRTAVNRILKIYDRPSLNDNTTSSLILRPTTRRPPPHFGVSWGLAATSSSTLTWTTKKLRVAIAPRLGSFNWYRPSPVQVWKCSRQLRVTWPKLDAKRR